jgi:hypothetical protein
VPQEPYSGTPSVSVTDTRPAGPTSPTCRTFMMPHPAPCTKSLAWAQPGFAANRRGRYSHKVAAAAAAAALPHPALLLLLLLCYANRNRRSSSVSLPRASASRPVHIVTHSHTQQQQQQQPHKRASLAHMHHICDNPTSGLEIRGLNGPHPVWVLKPHPLPTTLHVTTAM